MDLHEVNWWDVNNYVNFDCIKSDIILEILIRILKSISNYKFEVKEKYLNLGIWNMD